MRTRVRRSALRVVSLVVLLAACTGALSSPPPRSPDAIRVAAFGFTESEILAELYSQALEAKGYPTGPVVKAGPRELVQPALAEGLIDIVPEYAGSALSFLTLGRFGGNASISETHDALAGWSRNRCDRAGAGPRPGCERDRRDPDDGRPVGLHDISDLAA